VGRLRFATALAIVGIIAAVSLANAPAAQAAAASRPCTVNSLRAVTPIWDISCAKSTVVTIQIDANAIIDNVNPPAPRHDSFTLQQTVSRKAPWQDRYWFPASWFVYQICTVISADGVTIGTACFDRSSTLTLPCGVNALGGLNPQWELGCPGGSSNLSVDASYHYTVTGKTTTFAGHDTFSYSMNLGQIVADSVDPHSNVTIVDSTVTVTDTNTGETLGTATFTR
jgi:hypothetical protein